MVLNSNYVVNCLLADCFYGSFKITLSISVSPWFASMLAGPGATEWPITIDCSIEQLVPWN